MPIYIFIPGWDEIFHFVSSKDLRLVFRLNLGDSWFHVLTKSKGFARINQLCLDITGMLFL